MQNKGGEGIEILVERAMYQEIFQRDETEKARAVLSVSKNKTEAAN